MSRASSTYGLWSWRECLASPYSDLYVTVQLWADSKPLTVPVQTSYRSFKYARKWDEWLELPFTVSTLPLSAQLAITVWDLSPTGEDGSEDHAVPFGGTTFSLFGSDDALQKGRQRCLLHRHRAADGFSASSTPAEPRTAQGRVRDGSPQVPLPNGQERELQRLEAVFKKHEMSEIPRVDWQDRMVFEKVKKMELEVANTERLSRQRQELQKHSRADEPFEKLPSNGPPSATGTPAEEDKFTLIIELPRFDFPVVFTDFEYAPTPITSQPLQSSAGNSVLKPPPEVQYGPGIEEPTDVSVLQDENAPPLIRIYDPEVGARDNPAENKHRRLVRSHRSGVLDRDLRPNAKIRDELNTIMSYGPTQGLSSDEKDLIWKFRHHLTREKKALTKFIKSVAWQDQNEVRQAIQILPKWTEIDVDDALELLGPTFDNPAVRAYAVARLRKADDDELLMYLLQLVQALKFEKGPSTAGQESSLAGFLISRAANNFMLSNYLHWYLMVECDDRSPHQPRDYQNLFAKVEFDFMSRLMETPGGPQRRETLRRQAELITVLSKLSNELTKIGAGHRPKMIEHVKKFLSDPANEVIHIQPPLPLPLDPAQSIVGCFPEKSLVFKSSLHPMLIYFELADGREYPVLFKKGDDLRQDQLVIQIISLMDRLLRKENLDLKLSPFRVLATDSASGAVQFVRSIPLQSAKREYGGNYILEYLREHNPDKKAELGVRKETMDNYVKSCAGYCVVTYLLGVGDRHLDNLLLTPDGQVPGYWSSQGWQTLRPLLPCWFRIHSWSRSQACTSANQDHPGNGRGHGWPQVLQLLCVPTVLFHRLHDAPQIQQPYSQPLCPNDWR